MATTKMSKNVTTRLTAYPFNYACDIMPRLFLSIKVELHTVIFDKFDEAKTEPSRLSLVADLTLQSQISRYSLHRFQAKFNK
jgi:hypothetical protein